MQKTCKDNTKSSSMPHALLDLMYIFLSLNQFFVEMNL